MNAAERLLREMFGLAGGTPDGRDVFPGADDAAGGMGRHFHPDVVHSLFGPSGSKETLIGRDAFLFFARQCADALADRSDEILAITPIDAQCGFVHARAYRRSRASGEEIHYEWAMLYRVEEGLITYGADMLDSDAQAFWGRIHQARP